MKQKLYKWGSIVLIILLASALLVFFIYNAFVNPGFWTASATSCMTIGIAIFVSYYLVQRQNSKQKQKEILLDLIRNLQLIIERRNMYDFSGQTKEEVNMRNRDVDNRIGLLKRVKGDFLISEEVDFIEKKFDEYLTFVGDYIDKIEQLTGFQKTLKRPIDLMDGKLFEMELHLYNISTKRNTKKEKSYNS